MICASYKQNGEVKCCFPTSVMNQFRADQVGKKFIGSWTYAPGKSKEAEFTIRECQCDAEKRKENPHEN